MADPWAQEVDHDSQPDYRASVDAPITARRKGRCQLCPDAIWPGDEMVKHGKGWAHTVCAEREAGPP